MKYPFLLLSIVSTIVFSCNPKKAEKEVRFEGEAQGTYYAVTYYDKDGINLQAAIDSFFRAFDMSVSVYQKESVISRFNKNDTLAIADDIFSFVFYKSMEVSEKTGGAFDITVMPLVNAWGFGFTDPLKLDSAQVNSLLQLVNYRNVKLDKGKLIKSNPAIMIDFNAIAQGYSADLIGKMLESHGIENYLVDVGGEVLAKGTKPGNVSWKVGIEKPARNEDDARELNAVVSLQNKALATSGNYRKYFVKDGVRYSHTIDPKTGYPVHHSVLSVSVLADDCISADAYATAFMVMGLEKTRKFLAQNPELEAYIIYSGNSGELLTWSSKGFNLHTGQLSSE